MITTACMNPCFDKTAEADQVNVGDVTRLKNIRVDVGGKGVNVAIVLKRLNEAVRCVGCLGEENADRFLRMITKEDVSFDYLSVPGEVRTNLKLLDNTKNVVSEFNEPGITLTELQLEAFVRLLKEKSEDSQYVVLSGRLPSGCPANTYQRCMKALEGRKVVLDTAGESLLHGIKEQPYLIKPNLPEMQTIMRKELRTLREIRDAAMFLIDYGAQNVVVSMGKTGAVFVNERKTLFAPALRVEARSTVGAGDAMVGGILTGLMRGANLTEAFKFGVAAGAASVMTDGTQLVRKTDFDALLPKVTVQEV